MPSHITIHLEIAKKVHKESCHATVKLFRVAAYNSRSLFLLKRTSELCSNPDDPVSVLSGLLRQLGQIKCISINAGTISSQGQRIHYKNLTNVKAIICFDHAWLGQMVFVLIMWSQFYIIFL